MASVICELRQIRQRKNMTLGSVATEANVSIPYLSEVERGLCNPSVAVLERVLAVYGKELCIIPNGLSNGIFERLRNIV